MHVVTVITDAEQEGFKNYLKPSCKYYGLKLTALEFKGEYISHRIKDDLLFKYLSTLPDDEIIFFTDAHDTIFLAPEAEIVDKFLLFRAPLVFSAEINCWPRAKLSESYPPNDHRYKYLNSGGFIGKAGYLKEIYQEYPLIETAFDSAFRWSNQYYWHYIYLRNTGHIKLDHTCSMFFNAAQPLDNKNSPDNHPEAAQDSGSLNDILERELHFFDNRIRFNPSGSFPCHLHFAGSAKSYMEHSSFDGVKPWKMVV